MCRKLTGFVSIVVLLGLFSPLAVAQNEDERFEFDGEADPNKPPPADPTDWMTSENWGVACVAELPTSCSDPNSFVPPLPDFGTRVEIDAQWYGANAPVIGPGDAAEAFGVRIGRQGGPGMLTMNGGTLDLRDECTMGTMNCNTRLRVGNDDSDPNDHHTGRFDLSGGAVTTDTLWVGSGSHGEMNMSGGSVTTRGDFSMDWTGNMDGFNAFSELNMTGGTINVGTFLRLYRFSTLNLDGGEIFVNFAALLGTTNGQTPGNFPQTPDVTVSITDGLLEAAGALVVGGTVTVDGGILRANRYVEQDPNATHIVEINGTGLLQFDNSQESVADVQALITSGVITTSEATPLVVGIVDVGGTDFTQVSACIAGDFDCDGDVDGNDFLKWQVDDGSAAGLALWEANYPTAPLVAAVGSVPEPSSVVLAMLVNLSLVFRRRAVCVMTKW